MISRERVSCPGTAIGQIGAAVDAVQCACGDIRHISLHDLRSQDYNNFILASGSNGFPQSGGILAYMINTFGPSAGRVSRRLSVCLSVMSSVVHHEGRVYEILIFVLNDLD